MKGEQNKALRAVFEVRMNRLVFGRLASVVVLFFSNQSFFVPVRGAVLGMADTSAEVISIQHTSAEEVLHAYRALSGAPKSIDDNLRDRLQRTLDLTAVASEIRGIGEYRIVVNESSNSLVVFSPASDMPRIKGLISKLDLALAQILVEALIVEFPVSRPKPRGWLEAAASGTVASLPGSFLLTNLGVVWTNGFVHQAGNSSKPARSNAFSYVAGLTTELDTALNLLATNNGVRILQRPRIMTSPGVSVSLFVGESQPGSIGRSGAYTCCPPGRIVRSATVELTSISITDDLLAMNIQQKTEDPAGTVIIRGVGEIPVSATTVARSQITTEAGGTILMGGMIATNRTRIVPEIAALEDIPWLGHEVNQLLSYPKRRAYSELIILVRAVLLSQRFN